MENSILFRGAQVAEGAVVKNSVVMQDSLISEGKTLTDQDKRSALYQKAQAQIQQQALWLPLAHPTAYALTRKDVQGYQVSPFGRQDFSTVSVKP